MGNAKSLFGLPQPEKKVKTKSVKDILSKATTVKKSPTIRKSSNVLSAVREAERLAEEKLSNYKDKYELILTKERLSDYLYACKDDIITLDTETNGLDCYINKVVGICLHILGEKACYIPTGHINPETNILLPGQISPEDIQKLFEKVAKEKKWIYHNAEFDIRFMLHTFNVNLLDSLLWDTLNVAHCIDENEIHKLKELHLKYCPDLSVNEKEAIEFGDLFKGLNFGLIRPEIGMLYAAGDPLKTRELYEWQKNYLEQKGNEKLNWVARNIEIPVIPVCIRMEEEGVELDKECVEELKGVYTKKLDNILQTIYNEIDLHKAELEDFKLKKKPGWDKLDTPINLGSPKQLSILLYDVLGMKPIGNSKSTSTDTLIKLSGKYKNYIKLFINLLEYRKVAKLVSGFVTNIMEKVGEDGCIHPKWNPLGASTGRMSSSNPNLQQIPSHEKQIRKMYRAKKNRYLIGSDYSKQEVFLAVEACLDPKLLEVFHNDLDIYSKLASDIFEVPYEDCIEFYLDENGNKTKRTNVKGKERRSLAKVIWLGISYGLGAQGFADNVNEKKQEEINKKIIKNEPITKEDEKMMTKEEAQKILDKIQTTYPTFIKWKADLIAKCKQNNYVETLWGRRRNLPKISAPKFEFDLITDELTGKKVCPSCFEENPLDWDNDNIEGEYTIKDVPKSIIQGYLDRLNVKYLSRQTLFAIKKEAREKDKLELIDNLSYIADAERQCVNSCIQGSAANLTKLAMILIDKDPVLKELDYKLCLAVHDELLGTAPCENATKAAERVQELMVKAGEGVVNHIDIKTDVSISERWYGEEIGMETFLVDVHNNDVVRMSEYNEEKQQYYTIHKHVNDTLTLELGSEIFATSKPIKSDKDIVEFMHSPEVEKYVKFQD